MTLTTDELAVYRRMRTIGIEVLKKHAPDESHLELVERIERLDRLIVEHETAE
jgi:hypothetical protein